MMISIVGSRYAHALAESIFRPGSPVSPEDAVSQLRTVEDLLASSPELRSVLITPAVPNSRKRAVMQALLNEAGVATVIRNLVFVLIDHQRFTELGEVRASFEALTDEHLGILRAEVTSAGDLTDAQKQALETALNQLSGKRVKMKTSVDAGLLGGVVARIGSTVYDGSVRGQLEGMRRKLSGESAD